MAICSKFLDARSRRTTVLRLVHCSAVNGLRPFYLVQLKWTYRRTDRPSRIRSSIPEPNRACLVGVYAVTLDPLLSLYGIIYVTWYTRLLPKTYGSQIPAAFGIPGHVTTKHLPDTPC